MENENLLVWARSVLVSSPGHWAGLAESLPAELMVLRPAPEEWSALECLQHLVDIDALFQSRVEAFLNGQDFPAFDPDRQGTRPGAGASPVELAAAFTRKRLESLAILDRIEADDLDRRVRHQELGPVTLGEMLHEWAGHDLMHTVQGEQALMQPFIQGCGPWQGYFKDHIVNQ